jgi:hypothetical protein
MSSRPHVRTSGLPGILECAPHFSVCRSITPLREDVLELLRLVSQDAPAYFVSSAWIVSWVCIADALFLTSSEPLLATRIRTLSVNFCTPSKEWPRRDPRTIEDQLMANTLGQAIPSITYLRRL